MLSNSRKHPPFKSTSLLHRSVEARRRAPDHWILEGQAALTVRGFVGSQAAPIFFFACNVGGLKIETAREDVRWVLYCTAGKERWAPHDAARVLGAGPKTPQTAQFDAQCGPGRNARICHVV